MLRFILRRMASAVVVLFTISVTVYLIFFATPGVDPAARIAGRSASPAIVEQVRVAFGLNRPLPIRYLLMMDHLFIKRDLTSYVNIGDKVVPQILAAAPVTLSLVFGRSLCSTRQFFRNSSIAAEKRIESRGAGEKRENRLHRAYLICTIQWPARHYIAVKIASDFGAMPVAGIVACVSGHDLPPRRAPYPVP